MRKAIVTLAVGEKYERMFSEHCKDNWTKYCNNFGYDLIVITEKIDKSERAEKRSPAWQKLLILSQKWSLDYDRIVWLDTDIVINNERAIDICSGVPIEKIGAVEAYSIPTREIHDIALERMYRKWTERHVTFIDNLHPNKYYTNRNIPGDTINEVVHTGVFICSPKYHRAIFEHIYLNYEDTNGSEWNFEMPAMSYELVKGDLVHWISPRFNFCVFYCFAAFYPHFQMESKGLVGKIISKLPYLKRLLSNELELHYLKNIYDLSIFMHFAGCSDMMPKIKKITSV